MAGINFDNLFHQFTQLKVGVIGDVMLDTYWWGRRFQFYYFCQGAKLHSQNFSLRTQAAMRLSTADPVLVIYNEFLSSRALLQDLYVWQSADKPQGKPK